MRYNMKHHLEAILSIAAASVGSIQALNNVLQTVCFLVSIGAGIISMITWWNNRKNNGGQNTT